MRIRRTAIFIFAMLFMVSIMSVHCLAATKYWKLRYVKGGPASVQGENWSATVKTTDDMICMAVTSLESGAEIGVYTDNGIQAIFSSTGSVATKSKKGIRVYAYAKFVKHGNATNWPQGKLVY